MLKVDDTGLTLKQRELAELMVAEPNLSDVQYAERIPCNRKSVYNWKKMPEFKTYVDKLCKAKFQAMQGKAIATMERLLDSNTASAYQAAQYVLNYQGFAPAQKVELSGENSINISVEGE